jgi:hypothetical protein
MTSIIAKLPNAALAVGGEGEKVEIDVEFINKKIMIE